MKKFLTTTFLLIALMAVCVNGAAFVDLSQRRRPPIGATYEKNIGIPVLGQQTFSLHILSDTMAHLLVKGKMLALDEVVSYSMTHKGRLNCQLSEHALERLRKVKASLKEIGYDGKTDTPYVKVSTPLPMPVKIRLTRKEIISKAEDQENDSADQPLDEEELSF